MSLTRLELRSIYKKDNNIKILKNEEQYGDYIRWLEGLVISSNINTIEGIKNFITFGDKCGYCENETYSEKHQICLTKDCVHFFDKSF